MENSTKPHITVNDVVVNYADRAGYYRVSYVWEGHLWSKEYGAASKSAAAQRFCADWNEGRIGPKAR